MTADVDTTYTTANARWPQVSWPLDAFRNHMGDESSAYGDDLFLAGAAGYRIDAAWVAIEKECGPVAQNILNRLARADLTAEDMWAETVVRLMADDANAGTLADGRRPAQIIRYRGLVPLLNYFITVARRLAIGRHRKRKEETLVVADDALRIDPAAPEQDSPQHPLIDRETTATMKSALAKAYTQLTAEQQFLLAMVYSQDMKQKDAGTLLNWSEFKTSREMTKAITLLRQTLVSLHGVEWTPNLADAWQAAWQNSWKNVQVEPVSASKQGVQRAES